VLKAFVALVFAASFGAKAIWMGTPKVSAPRGVPTRVISLAPSITEILFALSVGDRVVGVTRFCDHPPEVAKITKVGGYQDPSYEAIVGLRADLVILLPEHERPRTFLAELGIETLAIGNTTTEEILDSIVAVGRRMGAEAKAKRIVADVRRRLARVAERTRLLRPARVLVSIGRAMGSGSLKDVYVSGPGTLYDEAITLAGGKNACGVGGAKYPKLSAEGVLRLDPDVIIDLAADVKNGRVTEEAVIADWQSVPGARAVREGRVHIISEVYAVRPGPRFILLVEHLARILHPDVDWGRE
jgi:iron complex transport system substrate-binding protein